MPTIGGKVLSDYRWYFNRFPSVTPPPERWPYLGGIRRAEALQQEGTISFTVFSSPAPRSCFSPRQQDVLRVALLGKTDEAIARELGLSLVTVKKLWKSIYARVEDKDPSALLVACPGAGDEDRRGSEKRRFLLDYLRRHPEELRPRASHRSRSRA